MMTKGKKAISLLLTVLMLFSSFSVAMTAMGNDAEAKASVPTVKIVSFMRGEQDDYRSSELLEARVEGYEGNVRELKYEWTTTLGTYLYVYNSHNMYYIRNTEGEVEVYNSKLMLPTPDMYGRYHANTFSGTGYAWAAVHSSSQYDKNQLVGLVTVKVYDENGNFLCSDTHEGKLNENGQNTGFIFYDISKDLDDVVIGMFEGDKRNVKDLLGESAIVHIVCIASTVMDGKVVAGGEHIELTKEGDYYIHAVKAGNAVGTEGDALVNLTVQKTSCKFHRGSSGSATTTVFVFKKPDTSTTTTTLTLTNLDDRCEYYIDGVKGERVGDTVVFTGLTPNTDYMVEVRAEYEVSDGSSKYAYAYVYDTTKPAYKATVETYLDGALTDISDIHGEDVTLYLHEDKDGADYIELTKEADGIYTAAVENGIYLPWHIEAGDHYHQAREYKLIIENANGLLKLHHYSVRYDTNGGAFKAGEEVAAEAYSSMASVNATSNVPVRDGYVFAGWEYNGSTYNPGEEITSAISAPITLKAKWGKQVNVTINVTIDHGYNGGYDHNETKDELTVDFLEMKEGSPAFVETGDRLFFSKEGVTDGKGNVKDYVISSEAYGSEELGITYTANPFTYTDRLETSAFGVAVSKSGYVVGAIEKKQDKNGNWIINIPLTYNPDDFDIDFSVEMDKSVPKELYPDAVIVKLACWDAATNQWVIISQQRTTENTVRPGVRVDIDSVTGKGEGSYPVWKHDANGNAYGYRAVVAGFIYNDSSIIVPTEKDYIVGGDTVIVTYTDGNYTATMGDISDGMKFSTSLNGAYYNAEKNAQQGTLHGVITVEKYDVTFDAQGGTVNGKPTDTVKEQYYVPSFDKYKPVMEGHTFLGWYLDKECTIPAKEGVLLTEDITVYAKWDRILRGTVIVDGYYDSTHPVYDADRAKSALVELKEITADDEYNITGQRVTVEWTSGKHFSEPASYEFNGLDPDKNYRVDVYLVNYKEEYQNSETAKNETEDIHDDYNEYDYKAIYTEESKYETFVNVFLHFEPEEYIQYVKVDATRIGAAERPKDAFVKYYSEEMGVDDNFVLIVQHKDEKNGVTATIDTESGITVGNYGEKVWRENYNGNLYNYQAELVSLDNKAPSEWPVSIVYGDPARWSPYNQSQTDYLKVILIPNRYDIAYNENYSDEGVNVISHGTHIWSYDTVIDYVPVREGYVFEGWYTNPECTGEKVTKISAAVAEDTNLYARWEKAQFSYTVNYLEEGTDKVLADAKTAAAKFEEAVTETAIAIEGYTVAGEASKTITIDTENNVINFYYVKLITVDYIVEHYKQDTDGKYYLHADGIDVLTGNAGDTVIAQPKVFKGYVFNSSHENSVKNGVLKAIFNDADIVILRLYYDVDKIGGGENGDEGDGTPDMYQKLVIFKVVNGTWADGSADDIICVLALDENGKATVTVPAGMKANDGFEGGAWDVTPSASVSGTNKEVYTYSFTKVVPETPETPETPDVPETPDTPDAPGGEGGSSSGNAHHIVFGKTDGIGWYNVSQDGGKTFDIVFGNSTYEVSNGTEIIIRAGDIMGDAFTYYVNGNAVKPDDNGEIRVTVNGYMLIGAIGIDPDIDFAVPDAEESLNWFQKLIKAIKDFFNKIFGWMK